MRLSIVPAHTGVGNPPIAMRSFRAFHAAVAFLVFATCSLTAQPPLMHARGTFDVQITPQPAGADPTLGRMNLAKQFSGDITGTSTGTMLTGMTGVANSAGYVAVERVTGTVHGRKGSFTLQHSGTMNRGAPSLTITIVPDSGTNELAGISGAMTLVIEGKTHSYTLDYTIAATP